MCFGMANATNEIAANVLDMNISSDNIEVQTITLVAAGLTSTLVTFSNCLVLVLLLLKSELRRKHRLEFILWLCLSDIFVGISGWMFVLNYLVAYLSKSALYCSAMYHFIVAGIGQSLGHTFLICIDRYIAVVKNTRLKQFNRKYRYRVIFGTCFLVVAYVGTLVAVYLRVNQVSYCSVKSFSRRIDFAKLASFLYIPLLILIPCLYIVTIANFRSQLRRTDTLELQSQNIFTTIVSSVLLTIQASFHQQSHRQNYEKQVMVTTGLIAVALLVLTGPYAIGLSLEGLSLVTFHRKTRIFITMLSFVNSAINPVLYVWRIRRFRKEVCNICCSWC